MHLAMLPSVAQPCRAPGLWSSLGRRGPRRTPVAPQHASKLPDRGFFSDVDPSAEVYPVKSGLDNDVTKRGGRWQSDFIWNTNWKDKLDYEESLRKQKEEGGDGSSSGEESDGEEYTPGKLRLAAKVDLNSMDVDLTQQLLAKKKPLVPAGSSSSSSSGAGSRSTVRRAAANPPTRLELKGWERSGKFSRKVVATSPTNSADEAALQAARDAERDRYEQLKAELQAWAAGLTAVCLAATFAFYGRDVAASYGVGALGGLMYLRLLNKSVDGLGGGAGAALGQPRLLIPVILALGYNRYNTLLAEETGIALELLPMLLGFFTYKGAVIAKQSLTLFGELAAAGRPAGAGAGAGEGEGEGGGQGGQGAVDVTSVDRAFAKKILTQ